MSESGKYGYLAFYNGKQAEVYATSLYAAKLAAIALFKTPKSRQYQVTVVLCERPDGSTVIHTAVD